MESKCIDVEISSRNSGNGYANDSSITHFNEASIANLIRELPQNSFDAKHDGCIDPSFRRMLLMQCAWAASCRRQDPIDSNR